MCYTEKQIIGGDLIELRVLRYFLTVAQEENISHAAGILHVTQPTLSRQLADLEYELGVKLFHRGNRRITLTEPVELSRYEFLRLRERDRWGVITYEGSPLAAKENVTIDDLKGLPLMLSRRAEVRKNLAYWFGEQTDSLHIFATYNLIGNATQLVSQGLCHAFALECAVTRYQSICFRPLSPELITSSVLVWTRRQPSSEAVRRFIQEITIRFSNG